MPTNSIPALQAALNTPVIGFAAFSGTGKTTLLKRLIPVLRRRGLRLGLIKHSHHAFEVDRAGKDSYRLRHAGATQLVVSSRRRSAVMMQYPEPKKAQLADFLRRLDHSGLDLILVEGYKHAAIPKIELHRPSLGHPLLALDDPAVIAIASDAELDTETPVPLLTLSQTERIADFIESTRIRLLNARS